MHERASRTVLRGIAVVGLMVLSGVGMLATAGQASAATRDGSCNSGEYCNYYLEDLSSYNFDFASYDANYANDKFPTNSSITPDNNTESYWNRNTVYVDVYTESGGSGVHGWIPNGLSGNYSTPDYKNGVTSAYQR